MGGDRAPEIVVEGASLARERFPNVRFLLFGDREKLDPLLARSPNLVEASKIRHTEHSVSMADKPSQVMRRGRTTSMGLSVAAVATGEADAVVSAGNTGALMALAMFQLKLMDGVDRPAISALWPTESGRCVFLDMGANVEATASQLAQFAVLGTAFAQVMLGISRPRVGLLNVGSEEMKGHESVRDAARLLRNTRLHMDFVGFVEGTDIATGAADVIVTDGFTGNVAIKTAEGTARLIGHFMRESFRSNLLNKIGAGLAFGAFSQLKRRMDPNALNGGVFLGLNGIVVKSHGGTDARGFASAVDMAVNLAGSKFAHQIREQVQILHSDPNIGEELAGQTDVPSSGQVKHKEEISAK